MLATAPVATLLATRCAVVGADTWVGSTSANLADANWTGGGSVGGQTQPGDAWTFGPAGFFGLNLNDNLAAGFAVNGITFNATAGAYVIGDGTTAINVGNGITLTGGITNGATVTETIDAPVTFNGTQTFTTTAGGGNLTLGGAMTGTGGLVVSGGGTVTLDSNATSTFAGGVTVNQGGALVLNYANLTSLKNLIAPQTLTMNGGTFTALANGTGSGTSSQTFTGGVTINSGFSSILNTAVNGKNMALILGAITENTGGIVQLPSGSATTTTNTNTWTGSWAVFGGDPTTSAVRWAATSSSGTFTSRAGTGAATDWSNISSASNVYNLANTASGATTLNASTPSLVAFGIQDASTLAITAAFGADKLTTNGISNISGLTLTLNGATTGGLAIGAATGCNNQLVVMGNGNVVISVPIFDSAATGGSVAIDTGGVVTLNTAASTYTGTTTLDAGTLTLGLANVLNAGSRLVVNNGTAGFSTFNQNVAAVTLTGGAITGTTGTLTSGSAFNVQSGTISGILAGTAGLTKSNVGTVTLSGANQYTGTTAVNGGTLLLTGSIAAGGSVVVNAGGTLSLASTGSIGASTPVSVNVGGTLIGTGAANGGISVAAQGTINLVDNALGTLTTANLIVGGPSGGTPAVLNVEAGGSGADRINLGGNTLIVNAGGATINVTNLGNSLVSGEALTLLSYAQGIGAGFATGTGTTVGSITLGNPALSFGVTGSLNVSGTSVQLVTSGPTASPTAFWTGKYGTAWSNVDATNAFGNFATTVAGTTDLNTYPGPNTAVSFSAANATNATTTLGQNFNVASLEFLGTASGGNTAAATITGNNTLTIGTGGIALDAGNGGATLGMTTLALSGSQAWNNGASTPLSVTAAVTGSATAPVTLTLSALSTGSTTIAGSISDGGASGPLSVLVNGTGAGLTILSHSNAYTGGTTLNGGTLQMGANGTLGSASGPLAVNAGTLDLNGTNQSVGAISGSGGTILNNSAAAAATLSVAGGSYGGVLANNVGGSQTLGLTKTGTGALTLSGVNTYSGTTNVSGGTLTVAGSGTVGGGAAPLTVGAATLDLGGTTQTVGAMSVGAGGSTATIQNGSLVSPSYAANNNSGLATLSANLLADGSAGLTKNGNGVVALGGNNTYTGPTTVNGTAGIVVNPTGTLGAAGGTANVSVGAALMFNGSSVAASYTINGAGTGQQASNGAYASLQRGFVQGYAGNSSIAAPINVTGVGIQNRIGVQDGANLTLTGPVTAAAGINVYFRVGGTGGGNVVLTNAGNAWTTDTQIFSNANLSSGLGTLQLGVTNALPTGASVLTPNAGTGILDMAGFDQTFNGLTSGSGLLQIENSSATAASTLTLANNSVDQTANATTVLGNIAVVKTGTFAQTLNVGQTYTGSTTITAGTLSLSNASSSNLIPTSVAVSVGSGATLNVTGLASGTFQLASGQALGGTGTVVGSTTIVAGGTVSAGTSAALKTGASTSYGSLVTGSQTWTGGTYAWKLLSAGTAGAAPGTGNSGSLGSTPGTGAEGSSWDLLNVSSGGLVLSSLTTGAPFTIAPVGSVAGPGYSWVILQSTGNGSIALPAGYGPGQDLTNGGAGGLFVLSTSGFTDASNPFLSAASFSVEAVNIGANEDLVLDYLGTAAAPEPTSLLLVLGSGIPMCLARRRRQQRRVVTM